MSIEKINVLGVVLELPAKKCCQFSPFGPFMRKMVWIGTDVLLMVVPAFIVFSFYYWSGLTVYTSMSSL
jgi:hypothetical protein